jgi:pteridine reductase
MVPKPKQLGFSKPVALVTGAAGSLGRAICLKLAQNGYDLALHGRQTRSDLWALAHEVEFAGAKVALYAADLSHPATAASLIDRAVRNFGRLDLLVNSASEFFETPRGGRPGDWDVLFRTNAVTPYYLARSASIHLAKTGGSVVNLVDVYAEHPVLTDHPAYLASKAALLTLTKVLARELSPKVRVNGVSPGAITFPSSYTSAQRRKIAHKSLLKKAGTPEDVADAVSYLASASFVTGELLRVDGGRFV